MNGSTKYCSACKDLISYDRCLHNTGAFWTGYFTMCFFSVCRCIAQQWRCDIEPDCDQNEDEIGCGMFEICKDN